MPGRDVGGRAAGRGRARGTNPRARDAAAPAAEDAEPDIDFQKHPAGIILLSHSPPKGIRFSVEKILFHGFANYDSLPDRLVGEVNQWTGGGRAAGQLSIDWLADQSNTVQYLATLLQPRYNFRFEKYENGKPPPRAKGMEAKRLFAAALANGPYAGTWSETEGVQQAAARAGWPDDEFRQMPEPASFAFCARRPVD